MRVAKCGWLVAALVLTAGAASAAEADTPTFTEDVAQILYDNCVICHRVGEVAPMSLITYRETRPWGRSIKNKVLAGEMPPWHADPSVGRFLNDRRLTDAERDTIVRWVDGGAPEGDRARLPPAPTFADGWQIGTPTRSSRCRRHSRCRPRAGSGIRTLSHRPTSPRTSG